MKQLSGKGKDKSLPHPNDKGLGFTSRRRADSAVDKSLKNELANLIQSLNLPEADITNFNDAKLDPQPKPRKEKPKAQRSATASKKSSIPANKVLVPHDQVVGVRSVSSLPVPPTPFLTKPGRSQTLILPPTSQWYDAEPILPPKASLPEPSAEFLQSIRTKAEALLETEAKNAAGSTGELASALGSSDMAYLNKILTSGTLSDRLSALTLMAQASPLHNQRALESLRTMASKKGREESLKALRAIVDWWVGSGAPNKKLKYLRDHPLTHPNVTDQHLLLWAFEDWLKKYFFSILQLLETLSMDPLSYVRIQTLTLISALLKEKPEQEQNLLRLLVNKLGDTDKTVASKASYLLLQLLQIHPSMKSVVVREISSLIFRPSTTEHATATLSSSAQHAQYYGTLTFNQITLMAHENEIAELLIAIYFELFKAILGQGPSSSEQSKGAVRSKNTKNGAPPEKIKKTKQYDKGKLTKPSKDSAAFAFVEVEDVDSKMLSAVLTGVNRALPFAKMERSVVDEQVETLFKITHTATFNVSLQALVLISHVSASRPSVSDRFYRALYESILDSRLCDSSKQPMYLNLLFKAMKSDKTYPRLCAFVKRLLQSLELHQPGYTCGALYMLGEIFSSNPGLRKMLNHAQPVDLGQPKDDSTSIAAPYDPRKRDPQFAGAEGHCFWDLVPLLDHFHPSVALHAQQLINGQPITATADLSSNTVSQFLDRFVYKNPKKPKPRGASSMQPAASNEKSSIIQMFHGEKVELEDGVNTQGFWEKRAGDVPADQLFFHKFFGQRLEAQKAKGAKKDKRKKTDPDEILKENSVSGASDDDSDEHEIWEAMKKSMPKADADISEDDDSIPADLDDDDEESSGEDEDALSVSDQLSEVDEGSSILELEEDEDLLDLADVFSQGSSPSENEDWSGVDPSAGEKRKQEDSSSAGRKKRRINLPTFASYEDYATLIDNSPEDHI